MRGGLRGFAVFICLHRARRRGDRRRRLVRPQPRRRARARRPRDPRRRCVVLADGARGERRRTRLPRGQRPALGRRHHAGDGARRNRDRAGRNQGGRRALSAFWAGFARSKRANLPEVLGGTKRQLWRGRRPRAAGAAQPRARRAHHRRRGQHRAARRAQERARQARRRHRLRPAPADQRGRAARDRPGPARQPGALALPPAHPRRRRQRPRRRLRSSPPPRRGCPTPAGKCARAPTPRRRSAATSSASRNTSRWSA